MIAVWYDLDTDQIFITNEERSYARRSLVASLEGGDYVGVRLKFRASNELMFKTSYTNLTDQAGMGFLSAVEAKTYLDGEFAKRRSAGDGYAIPVTISTAGQTVLPLNPPPSAPNSLRVEVNGVTYRMPEIAVSDVAVTWLDETLSLDPSDRVTVVYS